MMKINTIKTQRVSIHDDLYSILQASLPTKIPEKSVVIITSKIISLCEGSCIKKLDITKDELIKQEAEKYLERSFVPGGYVMHTMKNNMLMPSAGIDGSNTDDYYALLPKDSYLSAQEIHVFLRGKYKLDEVGVIVSDSRSGLLRKGVVGYALGFYGITPLLNYRGTKDLFGNTMNFSQSNIIDSLAAAGVLVMGEGAESTPIAIATNFSNIEFSTHFGKKDLELSPDEDIYMPFYNKAPWKKSDM